jgi:hypothetical protein
LASRFAVIVALILLVSACDGTPADNVTPPALATTPVQTPTALPDGSVGTATPSASLPVDAVPISVLVPTQPIVAPGTPATLSGLSDLNGQLQLTGPDGAQLNAAFTEGEGSVFLPDGAAEGQWRAVVTAETGALAVGSVEVANGPSLLLTSDRSHVGPAGDVTVVLHAAGLPDDTKVLFGWGDLDWGAYFEDEEGDDEEPLGVLVPDHEGLLQVGAEPVALSDAIGIPLVTSGLEVAGLQAMAFSATSDEIFLSNPLRLQGCAAPVPVQGTIGGPGALHLLSLGDGLRSAAVITPDGAFNVDVPHGPTAFFAVREDVRSLQPLHVDLPCGGIAELDLVAGLVEIDDAVDATAATDDAESVPGDDGTLTLGGDQAATFPVEPVCQYRRGEISIIFATYDQDLPAVQLTIPGGEQSGNHPATVEITDWTAGAAQSTGIVEVSITYAVGSPLADSKMTVVGEFAGDAGAGTIDGAFSCSVLGLTPPVGEPIPTTEPEVSTEDEDPFVEPPPTVFDTPGPGGATRAPACRTIVVDDIGDTARGIRTAVALRARLPRATVVTLSELHAIFGADGGPGQILGPGRSSTVASSVSQSGSVILAQNGGATGDSYEAVAKPLLTGNTRAERENWVVTAPVDDMADTLVNQVLCIDVDPIDVASGATEDLVVQATDLTGSPITEASVAIGAAEYGVIAPAAGTLRNGTFQAEYTGGNEAGEESLSIEVGGAQYSSTRVSAGVATGFAYTLEGQYRVVIGPAGDDAPVPPGPLGVTLVARSCTGRYGPWDGVLALEAGPLLAMIGITGAAGTVASSVFGAQTDLQDGPIPGVADLPIADIGLSMLVTSGLGTNPEVLADVAEAILIGVDNPYRPVVLAAAFGLTPRSGTTVMGINGQPSGFVLRVRADRRDVVQLTAEGTHLLNAVVKRAPSCPTDAELSQRVGELVPEPTE